MQPNVTDVSSTATILVTHFLKFGQLIEEKFWMERRRHADDMVKVCHFFSILRNKNRLQIRCELKSYAIG
jgi:hypothetical protein